MRNNICLSLILLSLATVAFGQQNREAFRFLNTSVSAREAALGGKLVAADFRDAQLNAYHPQLINEEQHGSIYIHYLNYLSDIGATELAYTHKHSKIPLTFTGGFRSFSYGQMNETNEFGDVIGAFKPRDFQFYISGGYNPEGPWQYGASLKFMNSTYAQYTANAIAFDLGAAYVDTAKLFSAGVQLSNVGIMLSNYIDSRQRVPLNIAMGISKKLEKAPFRFLFTLDNLQDWNVELPQDTRVETDPLTGEDIRPKEKTMAGKFFRNFTRHLYAGTEIVFSDNFQIRLGYNYYRRVALTIPEKPGTTGLSYGFSFRVSKFHLSYANAKYHLSGVSHFFSVTTNFYDFWSKKQL